MFFLTSTPVIESGRVSRVTPMMRTSAVSFKSCSSARVPFAAFSVPVRAW